MIQKSYDDKASLFLIPTPIGNLEDITLRAIETLKQVEVVFSEDTRVTSLLMNHLGIKKKLISSYNFNEEKNENKLLKYLESGQNVGVVSDRGTPVISDPGYELAKIAIKHGYNVIGLPGATALIPALIMSGLEPLPFYFYGFLNNKETKRKEELENLKSFPHTMIFYEAPHRIEKTLKQMLEILGNRTICIAREISKKFETVYRGSILEVLEQVNTMKGEIVLLVEGNKQDKDYTHLTVIEHVNLYIKEGCLLKDAIKKVSKDRNVTKKEIYDIYHHIDRK